MGLLHFLMATVSSFVLGETVPHDQVSFNQYANAAIESGIIAGDAKNQKHEAHILRGLGKGGESGLSSKTKAGGGTIGPQEMLFGGHKSSQIIPQAPLPFSSGLAKAFSGTSPHVVPEPIGTLITKSQGEVPIVKSSSPHKVSSSPHEAKEISSSTFYESPERIGGSSSSVFKGSFTISGIGGNESISSKEPDQRRSLTPEEMAEYQWLKTHEAGPVQNSQGPLSPFQDVSLDKEGVSKEQSQVNVLTSEEMAEYQWLKAHFAEKAKSNTSSLITPQSASLNKEESPIDAGGVLSAASAQGGGVTTFDIPPPPPDGGPPPPFGGPPPPGDEITFAGAPPPPAFGGPPPPSSKKKISSQGQEDRSALFAEIRGGKKLRKASERALGAQKGEPSTSFAKKVQPQAKSQLEEMQITIKRSSSELENLKETLSQKIAQRATELEEYNLKEKKGGLSKAERDKFEKSLQNQTFKIKEVEKEVKEADIKLSRAKDQAKAFENMEKLKARISAKKAQEMEKAALLGVNVSKDGANKQATISAEDDLGYAKTLLQYLTPNAQKTLLKEEKSVKRMASLAKNEVNKIEEVIKNEATPQYRSALMWKEVNKLEDVKKQEGVQKRSVGIRRLGKAHDDDDKKGV